MNHGLMNGMFWAGVLLSSVPVLLGAGIGAWALRAWQLERQRQRAADAVGKEALP
jgi:hypothetical protein